MSKLPCLRLQGDRVAGFVSHRGKDLHYFELRGEKYYTDSDQTFATYEEAESYLRQQYESIRTHI